MYANKKIACVVLNYNDALQTIDFIQNMSSSRLIDVFVLVDNYSSDDSCEKLKKVISKDIVLRRTDRNGGYGFGNNYGVNIAKKEFDADYAIICNPDVQFTDDCLQTIVSAFVMDDMIAVASAMQINGFTNEEIKNCAWRVPTYGDYLCSSLLFLSRFKKHIYAIDKSQDIQTVGCVPGAFLVVDINHFLEVGGYDENIFLFGEESTLGFKMAESGYKSVLLTKQYYYHFHSTSIKKNIPKAISRHRMVLSSRMYYIEQYLKVSSIKKMIASLAFKVSLVEYKLLYALKK